MKKGREIYQELARLDEGALLKRVRDLKSAELLALMHYAEGLEPDQVNELMVGTALLIAAERYFARARKKQNRRVRRIL